MGLAAMNIKDAVKAKVFDWTFTRKAQRIRGLKITPQPENAIFAFHTVYPTVPVVEIFKNITGDPKLDMKPENLVASAFNFIDVLVGNLFTEHKLRMTGLPQGTRLHYRVTAGDGPHRSAVVIGTFATCFRRLAVTVHDVMIFNDGDPGLKASGELSFYFGYFFGQSLIWAASFDANIESGEVRNFPMGKGPVLETGQVPDSFSIFVRGVEYDWLGGPFLRAYQIPDTLPEKPVAYESDVETVADAIQTFEMPQEPGTYNVGYTLKSGPQGINYWVNGHIDIDVLPPSEQPYVPYDYLVDATDVQFINAHLKGTGARGGVGKGGKIHSFAIGPEQTLYMKRSGGTQWEKLEGAAAGSADCDCDFSAEIAMDQGERLHVLALHAGSLRHASLSVKGRSDPPRFRLIGEGVQPGQTVVSTADGTPCVIARDTEGALRVAALSGADRGKWTMLGGRFSGPVAALAGRREIEIFGVTPTGQPQTGSWRIGSGRRPDWAVLGRNLGRAKLRLLDVMVAGGQTHLLALTEDRRLLTLARGRTGAAWNGGWKDQGSLDELFFEQPVAPPTKTKTKTKLKKANGAVRPWAIRRRGPGEGVLAST